MRGATRAPLIMSVVALCLALGFGPVGASQAADSSKADELRSPRSPSGYAVIADLTPIHRVKTKDPVVFITVDDGVHKNLKARRLVERRSIPVTSFLTAWTVKDRGRFFERVSADGSIQNHSATHASFSQLSTDLDHEICYTQRKLQREFGSTPWMMRPPYGAAADSPRVRAVARRCAIERIVMWDTVIEDGNVDYRSGKLRPGSIILLHFGPDLDADLKLALRVARKAGLMPANLADYLPRLT